MPGRGSGDTGVSPTLERWSIPNEEQGIEELVRRLRALSPALVVLEASGGLELPTVVDLGTARLDNDADQEMGFEGPRGTPRAMWPQRKGKKSDPLDG